MQETLFAASHLVILVLGDSLFGPGVRRAIGLGSSAYSTRQYRRWLIKVVERMESRRPPGDVRSSSPESSDFQIGECLNLLDVSLERDFSAGEI